MKTITFYSYKGGVGRTLSLVNIANRLSEFGKKVCILDFDLEAPGLAQKYRNQITSPIRKGIVDYIYEFSANKHLVNSITEFSTIIKSNSKSSDINFIPAGNTDDGEYWKKLSRINWWNLFYDENSVGIPFFLDLKEKIIESFSPDYLLIDTRTGITEISAITMSILADSVAIFAANNYENISGSQKILESITKSENNLLDNIKEIHFTLTRIPLPLTTEDKALEKELIFSIEKKITQSLKSNNKCLDSFNIIHSDRDTEFNEQVKIGYDCDNKDKAKAGNHVYSISFEYLSLFNSLTKKDLTTEERSKFDSIKHFERIIDKAKSINNINPREFLSLLNEAKDILPNNSETYVIEGIYYLNNNDNDLALKCIEKAIELGDPNGDALFVRSIIKSNLGQNEAALIDINNYLNKNFIQYKFLAIKNKLIIENRLGHDTLKLLDEINLIINDYPNKSELYNLKSNFYLKLNRFEDALVSIYKALELDSNNSCFYATLAEIKAKQGDKLDFYRNFDISLQKGYDPNNIFIEDQDTQNIYRHFFQDEKFIEILEKNSQFKFLNVIRELTGNHSK